MEMSTPYFGSIYCGCYSNVNACRGVNNNMKRFINNLCIFCCCCEGVNLITYEICDTIFHHFENLALKSPVTIEHKGSCWFMLPRRRSKYTPAGHEIVFII